MANRTKDQQIQALRAENKDLRKRLSVYESEAPTVELADRLAYKASTIALSGDDVGLQVKTADLVYKRTGAYPTKSQFTVDEAMAFRDMLVDGASKFMTVEKFAEFIAWVGAKGGS